MFSSYTSQSSLNQLKKILLTAIFCQFKLFHGRWAIVYSNTLSLPAEVWSYQLALEVLLCIFSLFSSLVYMNKFVTDFVPKVNSTSVGQLLTHEMVITLVKSAFKNYPYVSNCVTYGCMCVGAEFSQQFINKRLLVSKRVNTRKY